MSGPSRILRFAAMLVAVACLWLPRAATAADCSLNLPGTGCALVVQTSATDDPTVFCPTNEVIVKVSLSIQCQQGLCTGPVPDTFNVCGATNTAFTISVCNESFLLRPKGNQRWRDALNDCSAIQVVPN